MSNAVSPVTESADYYANGAKVSGYPDSHVVSMGYLFHSTTSKNNGHVPYELWATFVWKFAIPGASGTATLNAYFRYTVN